MDLLINLCMTVVDIVVLEYFRRLPSRQRWLGGMFFWTFVAFWVVVLSALFATGMGVRAGFDFFAFRTAAWILFLHLPITLATVGLFATFRRPRHWRLAGVSWMIALAMAAVGIDAFLIEPTSLVVTEYKIIDSRIERPVRIVLLADIQTDLTANLLGIEQSDYLRRVFAQVAQLRPDVILLAGDYIHTSGDWTERLDIRERLRKILAESGFPGSAAVYGVQGNIDPPSWMEIFKPAVESARVPNLLTNATQTLQLPQFDLTLLDVRMSRYDDPQIDRPDPDRMHIVLGHCPDYALGPVDADLLLAGHTHGGQVRLPMVGALRTHSRVPREWAAGVTELPPLSEKETTPRRLIVSRGIGMECVAAPRLRFLCRPELVVIDLVPVKE